MPNKQEQVHYLFEDCFCFECAKCWVEVLKKQRIEEIVPLTTVKIYIRSSLQRTVLNEWTRVLFVEEEEWVQAENEDETTVSKEY
jgi:hypothetical protein